MFCISCSAPISPQTGSCEVCGAPVVGITLSPPCRSPLVATRLRSRIVYGLPLLAIALGAVIVAAHLWGERRALADRYQVATSAERRGDLVAAEAGFASAAGYRDARERTAQMRERLRPYDAAYRSALAAIDDGRFTDAIDTLVPIVRDLPDYPDASALLVEARDRQATAAIADADRAEERGDVLAADRAISAALRERPDDVDLANRLAHLRSDHPAFVYTRNGSVIVGSLDGAGERVIAPDADASWAAWSPDRSRVAFVSYATTETDLDGRLLVVDADGSNLRVLSEAILPFGWPVWSPDGARITFVNAHAFDRLAGTGHIGLWMVDVASGKQTDLTGDRYSFAASVSWSPEGDRIAFVDRTIVPTGGGYSDIRGGDVIVLDIASGQATDVTGDRLEDEYWVSWGPNAAKDELVVVMSPEDSMSSSASRMALFDLATDEITPIETTAWRVGVPVWSPDGAAFAFVDGDSTVTVWRDGLESWVHLPTDVAGQISWSLDGTSILAPASTAAEPTYLLPLGAAFGTTRVANIEFDNRNGPYGPPQWSPRQAGASPSTGVSGTALDPAN